MTSYAARTEVAPDKSLREIEQTLSRFGATKFIYMRDDDARRALIGFAVAGQPFRVNVPLPDPDAREFRLTAQGRPRAITARAEAYQQAVRSRWRAAVLYIKGVLVAVEEGLLTFEQAFVGHALLPGNVTLAEDVSRQLPAAREAGRIPALMPGLPALPAPKGE